MERTLQDVISHIKGCTVTGDPKNKIITDLTIDSRTAGKGSLFICLVGVHTDGHAYIEKAASLGAEAVLVEKDVPPVPGLVMIRVKSTQETMTELAPWFYDYPAQKMSMIGITGTNGKTTTTNILRTLLTNTGHKVGLIGTINIMIGDEVEASHNTTPDVVDLQRTLCRMADAGCDYVVMEVASHALALNRVAGIHDQRGLGAVLLDGSCLLGHAAGCVGLVGGVIPGVKLTVGIAGGKDLQVHAPQVFDAGSGSSRDQTAHCGGGSRCTGHAQEITAGNLILFHDNSSLFCLVYTPKHL